MATGWAFTRFFIVFCRLVLFAGSLTFLDIVMIQLVD